MNNNQIFNNFMAIPQERFDLLSAYIDGEVSEPEEQLVELWLSEDVNFRHIYQQQLRLRQLLIELPVPVAENSSVKVETELMIDRVFAQIDKRSQRRKWKLAGIGLVAATVVGMLGSMFIFDPSPQLSPVANSIKIKAPAPATEEPILVAMEEPLVPLPKAMSAK